MGNYPGNYPDRKNSPGWARAVKRQRAVNRSGASATESRCDQALDGPDLDKGDNGIGRTAPPSCLGASRRSPRDGRGALECKCVCLLPLPTGEGAGRVRQGVRGNQLAICCCRCSRAEAVRPSGENAIAG